MSNLLAGILVFFLSFSARTPKIEAPFDYEVEGGFETKAIYCSIMTERENGEYYDGLEFRSQLSKISEFSCFYKEAKNIDSQSLRIFDYFMPELRIGGTFNSQAWRNIKLLALVGWKTNWGSIQIESDVINRLILSIRFAQKFRLKDKIFGKPLLVYQQINDNIFWQIKLVLSYERR